MTSPVQGSIGDDIIRYSYTPEGPHRKSFRNPRGLKSYYSFYSWFIWNSDEEVRVEYSTTGISWSNTPQTVFTYDYGTNNRVEAFDIKIEEDSGGSQLVIWAVAIGRDGITGNVQSRYRRGTIADSSSTISWGTEQTIDSDIGYEAVWYQKIAIAHTDNNRLVVAFTEELINKGKDYQLVKLIGSDGDGATPSWSGETTWYDSSSNSNNQNKGRILFGLENFDSSYPNRVFLYAKLPQLTDTTTYGIATAVPEWNGTVFSNLGLGSYATPAADSGAALCGLVDTNNKAHLVYYDDEATQNSLNHRIAGTAGDDNFGSATTIGTTTGTFDAATISLDTGPSTDELYVFYHESADSVDFSYRTTPIDSISFSSQFTVSFHSDVTALSSWNRQSENSLHIGIFTTSVYYNEHPVYKALSTTLTDFEFPYRIVHLGPHNT